MFQPLLDVGGYKIVGTTTATATATPTAALCTYLRVTSKGWNSLLRRAGNDVITLHCNSSAPFPRAVPKRLLFTV